jgi:hypothetical protein
MDDVARCRLGLLCVGLGLQRVFGLAKGRAEGAAFRADNDIEAAGAASLAPSLARMAQLTTLNLLRTLRASAAAAL